MPVPASVVGVVLAGGTGSRLLPLTRTINKHLLPVNGQPMLYWPLRALWLAGVRLTVVVLGGRSAGETVEQFGSSFTPTDPPMVGGVTGDARDAMALCYVYQREPGGIGQALGCARAVCEAAAASRLVVVLGDNVFPGALPFRLDATPNVYPMPYAEVVCVEVADAEERYGCVAVTQPGEPVLGPYEKPRRAPPPGHRWLAVTGAYSLPVVWSPALPTQPGDTVALTPVWRSLWQTLDGLGPSARGEVEITDLLAVFHGAGRLDVLATSRPWIDAGEPDGYRMANDPAFWRGEATAGP